MSIGLLHNNYYVVYYNKPTRGADCKIDAFNTYIVWIGADSCYGKVLASYSRTWEGFLHNRAYAQFRKVAQNIVCTKS